MTLPNNGLFTAASASDAAECYLISYRLKNVATINVEDAFVRATQSRWFDQTFGKRHEVLG